MLYWHGLLFIPIYFPGLCRSLVVILTAYLYLLLTYFWDGHLLAGLRHWSGGYLERPKFILFLVEPQCMICILAILRLV